MHKERLSQLAAYLETVPEELFDFEETCKADSLAQLVSMCKREPDCGATACALGHMPCIWPDVFKWQRRKYTAEHERQWDIVRKDGQWSDDLDHPQEWFEITLSEFYYLFDYNSGHEYHRQSLPKDASLRDVVTRLREFIVSNGDCLKQQPQLKESVPNGW